MRFGVALGRLNPAFFVEVSEEADRLGFESIWLPEHLVFPVHMTRSPFAGEEHPPVPPSTPVFDAFAYLSFLAGRTERVRLATHVYNLALRHPFVAARALQTLDVVSGGRAICGVGAGWADVALNDLLFTYPGAIGVKTGYTREAGWSVAAAASRGGLSVLVVVLGDPRKPFADGRRHIARRSGQGLRGRSHRRRRSYHHR